MPVALIVIKIVVALFGLALAGGTLLGLSRNPHWFIRGWDFPRIQIVGLGLLAAVPYALWLSVWAWYDWTFLAIMAAMILYQGYRMYFYSPLARSPVKKRSPNNLAKEQEQKGNTIRLVVSNVEMQNDQYQCWMDVIQQANPDVILMLEVNQAWMEGVGPLAEQYPYRVEHPQDNMYGMAMLSRLELSNSRVRFIVDEATPSIQSDLTMANGQTIEIRGVHPKPPEPVRDQDSSPRDAELIVIGREIADELRPTIIGGDLNDVAWSYTTSLFLKVSRMLDPRMGRGFFNSWNAQNVLFRFPLDHIFHTDHFTLVDLHRLGKVGSDHFPMLIELHYEPAAQSDQPRMEKEVGDEQIAQEMIEQENEENDTGIHSTKRNEDAAGYDRGTIS